MKVVFSVDGWVDFLSWTDLNPRTSDPSVLSAILSLVEEIRRTPFTGTGKPEPMRNKLKGAWSRRLTREHRLLYRVSGIRGVDQTVEIDACRGHYT